MERRTVIKLRDRPTLIKETAEWFASKWHLKEAGDRKSTRLSSSNHLTSRMPSAA